MWLISELQSSIGTSAAVYINSTFRVCMHVTAIIIWTRNRGIVGVIDTCGCLVTLGGFKSNHTVNINVFIKIRSIYRLD